MRQWFVVHTQPAKEILAKQNLQTQGFEVYLPQYQKIRRRARKVDTVLSPLFPRYLFVSFDLNVHQWRSINGTRGVVYVLAHDSRPLFVADSIIKNLKAQENPEGIVPIKSLELFSKGYKVRILEGAFEGHTAVVETLNDTQRVQLLLNFLGRDARISLPLYAVEVA